MKLLPTALLAALLAAQPASAQSKQEPPVPVRTVAPEYPYDLRRDGVAGVVTLLVGMRGGAAL